MSQAPPQKPSPEQKRGHSRYESSWFLARWAFTWVNPLIGLGRRLSLTREKFDMPYEELSEVAYYNFSKEWQKELEKSEPSLFKALWRAFWHQYAIAALYKLFWGAFLLLTAFYFVLTLLDLLMERDPDLPPTDWVPWVVATAFFVACAFLSVTLQQMSSHSSRAGIRVRGALVAAVFNKAVRLGTEQNIGDVVGLVSADCTRVTDAFIYSQYLWSGPIEAIVIVCILVYLTSLSGLVGIGIIILMLPFQLLIAFLMSRNRLKSSKSTEARVQLMHEILLAIKLVKFYAWENSFIQRVISVREKERWFLIMSGVYKSLNLMIVFILPPLLALGIFAVYELVFLNLITPPVAFTTLSLFNSLRFPLIMLPRAIRTVVEGVNSMENIKRFLLKPDLPPLERTGKPGQIEISNVTAAYASIENDPVFTDLNFSVKPGQLVGVVGPVGSGKSTLLNVILGESRIVKGDVKSGGKIAYVPQNPWVQQATVRDNIVFGLPFDQKKYDRVARVSALVDDFEQFQGGDLMQIGERGINISGGQKQRIAFARALYSDADIILLDSPLSAVDQLTCTTMFQKGIKKYLKGKTVILVMHALELLKFCDVACIMRNCQIKYFGVPDTAKLDLLTDMTHSDTDSMKVKGKKKDDEQLYSPEYQTAPPAMHLVNMTGAQAESLDDSEGDEGSMEYSLSQMEDPYVSYYATTVYNTTMRERNTVKVKAPPSPFAAWMKRGNVGLFTLAIFILLLTQGIRIAGDYFIRIWTARTIPDSDTNVLIYGLLTLAFMVFLIIRGVSYYQVTLRAATNIHNKLFSRIINAPVSFFTLTPMGSVLNSFSRDQDSADQNLPDAFHMALVYTAILLTTIIIVCIPIPYYVIVAVALVGVFVLMVYISTPTIDYVKQFYGESGGPIFAHLSETLHGLAVVRAYGATERFVELNTELTNVNHCALFNLQHINLWLGFYLDLVGALMVYATTLFVVAQPALLPSDGGLAISNSIQLLVFFSLVIKEFNECRSEVNAIERMETYIRTTVPEKDVDEPIDLPKNWPPKGRIEFINAVMRYFSFWPRVLNNVNLVIEPGWKVGVCGRTGSGKSSLIMALFRLVELTHGKIIVDGIDIAKARRQELRGSLSIIPQEPVLFSGTVRSNLDPFDEYEDSRLWEVVETVGLKDYINALPGALHAEILENGENFSLGQKQLFCIARAILKDSKILVLDEATSAMDLETDNFVQGIVRTVFASRTVITIAHRLDTIIDSDRILVMQRGKVAEYDTVPNLLRAKDSIFKQLVQESGLDIKQILSGKKPQQKQVPLSPRPDSKGKRRPKNPKVPKKPKADDNAEELVIDIRPKKGASSETKQVPSAQEQSSSPKKSDTQDDHKSTTSTQNEKKPKKHHKKQ